MVALGEKEITKVIKAACCLVVNIEFLSEHNDSIDRYQQQAHGYFFTVEAPPR